MMPLTRHERCVLRRLEAGKSPGSALIVRFLERKSLVACHGDGSVVTTPAGRAALQRTLIPERTTP